jgi:hypothetical protein
MRLRRSALFVTTVLTALMASLLAFASCCPQSFAQPSPLSTLDEALASRQDLWGLAAIRQTNGPSYDFFARLLPPLRYVNARFHHYPITLSAPASLQKVRLVSNGSAINAKAVLKTWRDWGLPVTFAVGENRETFGQHPNHLDGPTLAKGYLPIVHFDYTHEQTRYEEEVFASVQPDLAEHGVIFVRFTAHKKSGVVYALIGSKDQLLFTNGAIRNSAGAAWVFFDDRWKWDGDKQILSVQLLPNQSAVLAVASKPMFSQPLPHLTRSFEQQRRDCANTWQTLLDRGTQLETPEPIVNNAWRSLIVASYATQSSNSMNYSYGDAYERLYQAECGDAVRALALFGHDDDVARMIPPLLDYTRDKLRFHNAGFKLQMLSHYYWLTHDPALIKALQPKWTIEVNRILEGREKESGLFPREQYCGDIFKDVYSLHSNGAGWRGLRDFAAVLADLQTSAPDSIRRNGTYIFDPASLTKVAAEFREAILQAADKSQFTNVQPPFIPVALFGEEKPYDPLTASMLGSYWDLMAPYMLGSGMFGLGSPRERAILDYLQEHGGIFMGMIRFHQHSGLFANEDAVDDLYGLRYTLKLLQLDEVDRALASFYGKLAQGLTRDTFVGAEGTGLRSLDPFGRPMYLPPNTSSDAFFLWTLRYLLIQDWDQDDDGRPETLRLCFATPKAWLEDGKVIHVENAPTAFGPVSFTILSHLSRGEVIAELQLPTRNPAPRTLFRSRLPDGWKPVSAKANRQSLTPDRYGTLDISNLAGKVRITLHVSHSP